MSLNELEQTLQATIICKQAKIKFSLAYSFQKIFFIGQFKARSHDIFFSQTFDVLLINSSRHLFVWGLFHFTSKKYFISIQTSNETNHEIETKEIYIYTCFWYWCWKIMLFFWCRVKIPYEQFLIFLSFMIKFSEAAICSCSSK